MNEVRFDIERGTIDRSSAAAEINPFDLNALEAAIEIKEKLGGAVIAISMGPHQAELALRDAISRGADRALLLEDAAFAGADTLATSYTLASAIKKVGEYGLIICGEKTVDGDTGQVGAEIAEHLGIPHVAYVSKLIEITADKLVIASEMEGERYLIASGFPLLLSVTKDINTPRLATFRDKLKARKAGIETWSAEALADTATKEKFGREGSPTRVHRISIPDEEGRRGRVFRNGSDEEALKEILGTFSAYLGKPPADAGHQAADEVSREL
jgi:electron transfer flavoprotein beta subunit